MTYSFEDIDKIITAGATVTNEEIHEIYGSVLRNPLEFLNWKNHFIKYVVYYLLPMVVVVSYFDIFMKLIVYIGRPANFFWLIWLWLFFTNKYACYSHVRILMIFWSIFPSQNLAYKISGKIFSYKNCRTLYIIACSIITFIYIIAIIAHVLKYYLQ